MSKAIKVPKCTPTANGEQMFTTMKKIRQEFNPVLMLDSPIKSQCEFSTYNSDRDINEIISQDQSPSKIKIDPTSEKHMKSYSITSDIDHSRTSSNSPLKSRELLRTKILQQKSQALSQTEDQFQEFCGTQTRRKDSVVTITSAAQIFEERQCKFCKEEDVIQNFIRPCLCKGSMQHVHQKCLQQDIETNYMDESKRLFKKELICDLCQFRYVIRSYQNYSISLAMENKTKKRHLGMLSCGLVMDTIVFIALVIIIGLYSPDLQHHIDILILLIIFCIVCITLFLVLVLHISQLFTLFSWKILDRTQEIDNGIPIAHFQTLNNILQHARDKLQVPTATVTPI